MGSFSLMHWLVVLAVVVLLFGAGRISGIMGDVAKGIKSFKKGLAEDDKADAEPKAIEQGSERAASTSEASKAKS
jgi:sec-independent protein translocase protein TatA